MKTALWESSPGALVALINSKAFVYAHLYTITLFGTQGTIQITDADFDIAYSGLSFSSKGPFIDVAASKAVAHWKRGIDVDTWIVVVLPRSVDVSGAAYPDKIGSSPWIAAARAGALDGADVQVDRAYFPAWPQPYRAVGTPTGVLTMFAGTPAEVDCTDTLVALTLNDYREKLLQKLPRNLYQAGCRFTLYGPGCTLNPAIFARTGTIAIVNTPNYGLSAGVLPVLGSGTYAQGSIVMTSGLNAGFSRTIVTWNPNTLAISLLNPLPFAVAVGDGFTIKPGCDRQQPTCTLFGNLANYGGEPFVPDATTAV